MHRREIRIVRVALLLTSSLAWGCHGGQRPVPEGWSYRSGVAALARGGHQVDGCMQVIVCYERRLSSHAAVRLVGRDGTGLLWDPGGGYYVHDPDAVGRRADLVTRNVPTLAQWWDYRRSFTREPFNAVFEWEMSGEEIASLAAVLRASATDGGAEHGFHTDTVRGRCALVICDFLRRFGAPYVTIRRRYLWPHALGWHLRTQGPDRILVFHGENGIEVWTRDTVKSSHASPAPTPESLVPSIASYPFAMFRNTVWRMPPFR